MFKTPVFFPPLRPRRWSAQNRRLLYFSHLVFDLLRRAFGAARKNFGGLLRLLHLGEAGKLTTVEVEILLYR